MRRVAGVLSLGSVLLLASGDAGLAQCWPPWAQELFGPNYEYEPRRGVPDYDYQPRRKVPSFYIRERFVVESVRVVPFRQSLLGRLFGSVLERIINRNHFMLDWYERSLHRWFPAASMHVVLRPKKPISGQLAPSRAA